MTLSVVIPFHRDDCYLIQAIESTIQDLEPGDQIILVDDRRSPEDLLWQASLNNDKQISIVYLKAHGQGPGQARNIGIENASHEFVSFLDSDDLWVKGRRGYHLRRLSKNSLIPGIASQVAYLCPHGMVLGRSYSPIPWLLLRLGSRGVLRAFPRLRTSGVTIRKEILQSVGLFREDEELAEDYGLWLRIQLSFGSIAQSNRIGAFHRVHGGQVSRVIGNDAHSFAFSLSTQALRWVQFSTQKQQRLAAKILDLVEGDSLSNSILRGSLSSLKPKSLLDLNLSTYFHLSARKFWRRECKQCLE